MGEAKRRLDARIKAIQNGEVEVEELKGEAAIQFAMNHPGMNCTRQEAEKFVSSFRENNIGLMVTKPKSPSIPIKPFIPIKPKHAPSPFVHLEDGKAETVFDTDEELFWAIEEAL